MFSIRGIHSDVIYIINIIYESEFISYSNCFNYNYIDEDIFIESLNGFIRWIIQTKWREKFNTIRKNSIKKISSFWNTVISTGWGTGIIPEVMNYKWIKVLLKITAEEYNNRINSIDDINSPENVRRKWFKQTEERLKTATKRIPLYEDNADIIINAEKEEDEIIAEIIKVIESKYH